MCLQLQNINGHYVTNTKTSMDSNLSLPVLYDICCKVSFGILMAKSSIYLTRLLASGQPFELVGAKRFTCSLKCFRHSLKGVSGFVTTETVCKLGHKTSPPLNKVLKLANF